MGDCCCITSLGYAAAIYILFKICKTFYDVFYPHVLAKRLGHTINFASYGKWAVITGSTDGIGKGYAKELARRGMNVFLISRSQSKLDETAKEIEEITSKNVEVRKLAFDFSASSVQPYDSIKHALEGLEIGVLVNNVGVANDYPDYFTEYKGGEKFYKSMIDINCFSATEMTYIVLPQMIKRHKGIVINVSSAAGFVPTPTMTVYAATKSFLSFFTRGLSTEYKHSGVIFQCVHPYYVATKMSKIRRPTFFAPDPNYYANSALNTVGIESTTVGCLSHAMQHALLQLLPTCVYMLIAKKMCLETRDKYLAKLAKTE